MKNITIKKLRRRNQENKAIICSDDLFGLVSFEEPGMPWTAVRGKYRLIKREIIECFGTEPHWVLDMGNGKTCYVPESSVVVLLNK